MRNQILALAGAAALAGTLTACSSGPQSASSVVTGDGYTTYHLPSTMASALGADRNAVSSYAAGTKPGQPGLPVEVVLVFKSSTTAERFMRESQATPHSGVAVTVSGDVMRVSGSDAAIQALP